jgi:hypothetical protein
MLFWEKILSTRNNGKPVRLPGVTRCAAVTKAGRRCRGKVRPDSPYCVFHDPQIDLSSRRRANSRKPRLVRPTRYHLPGVASRLTTRKGITAALDRLYNDTREGQISPQTGLVLFGMLEHLLAAYNKSRPKRTPHQRDRSRAAALCRRLARQYISVAEKERAARRDGAQAAPADPGSSRQPHRAGQDRQRLRFPLPETAPPETVRWPGELAAQQA